MDRAELSAAARGAKIESIVCQRHHLCHPPPPLFKLRLCGYCLNYVKMHLCFRKCTKHLTISISASVEKLQNKEKNHVIMKAFDQFSLSFFITFRSINFLFHIKKFTVYMQKPKADYCSTLQSIINTAVVHITTLTVQRKACLCSAWVLWGHTGCL